MRRSMSMHARRELVWAQAKRCRDSGRAGKSAILDGFCETTGLNRKYAIGLLKHPPVETRAVVKRRRRSRYAADVSVLERLWEVSGHLCGKRLAAAIPSLLDALVRHGEMEVTPSQSARLRRISAGTVDRLLQPRRRAIGWRGKAMTKPGTLLRNQIPIRTYADWDEQTPGFFEADLAAHCGGTAAGDFAYTLTLTDVHTGWTELAALPNRSQIAVCDAIDRIRRRIPFPMLGIDSDNGSEFINNNLQRYCEANRITFTRCRPYRKNDQCHVESKNWSVVRAHVAYWRYEGTDAVSALASLHSRVSLSVNFFRPSLKLKEKTRRGAKVTRRHDEGATPYQRLIAAGVLNNDDKDDLQEMFLSLNPADIANQIHEASQRLYKTAMVRNTNDATNNL